MSDIGVSERPLIIQTGITVTNREKPDTRQQSKIIGVVLRGDLTLISIPSIQLKPDERDEYLKFVSRGVIGETAYSELLNGIRTPITYELDERNPVGLFGQISADRQMMGIVASFVRGNLQARDSLTPYDLYIFLRQKFSNALAYEKVLSAFLERIECSNGKQKRSEYEISAEKFGHIVYGKQWEYLNQIRLLETEAKAGQPQANLAEKVKLPDLKNGLEQSQQFNREHRLTGQVLDGYKDGGRTTRFDHQGRAINPSREIIVVDRKRDVRLRRMIKQAKAIQTRDGTGLKTIFELSKLVYEKMNDQRTMDILERLLDASSGREVLLGDITVENGLAGVCRHRSLLFQVLAAEVGIKVSLIRGNVAFGNHDTSYGHAWNEVELYGNRYLVDIMNPPGSRNFKNFDYNIFMRQGGFPEIGVNRSNYRYMDVNGAELYRV